MTGVLDLIPRARCQRCGTRKAVQVHSVKNYATGRGMFVRVCWDCFCGVYL